jgi:hypothetical protein
MSYSAGETLILTRVRACAGFDATNTSQSDWALLNRGKSDHYAILHPGAFKLDWVALSAYTATWTTVVEVWQRWTADGATHTSLYGYVNALLPILAYPHGGGAMEDMTIQGGAEPQEMWNSGGGPEWLRWSIQVVWTETSNVTFSE